MSIISEVLKKLDENEVFLTKEQVRNIINEITLKDYELEEDEELKEIKIKTMYNEYTAYGLTYEEYYIIPAGDYDNYLRDIAGEFDQCLPDGFDKFFNTDLLYTETLKDNTYLEQSIDFINKNTDTDYYKYVKVDSGMVNGIDYILIKEV